MKRYVTAAAVALLIGATSALGPSSAHADTAPASPGPLPSGSSAPPVHVDPHAPGLKLMPGATLATPKVLDIKTVVEDSNGAERRSDTPADVTFSLQSEVLFDKDSATLSPDAQSRVKAIADEINRQNAKSVQVFGFTDNLGSHDHGVELSKQRAEAVYTLLAQDLTADGGIQFDVRGYAEDFPIADNSTEDGRRKNRRVQITFPKARS
ncbi:OmpA family protein [Streptantibioticus ferralitis]|uniref:OmpA family protein n=1 Tax=Streptantibioticus ferralitis TaxID=236510 RepID=A0ABT5ZCR0_9ACTN|nr:OmpA family protein [Streptantibioticus ferralitis]MDF2261361.1 OmpA family protein [Streptantibioticus ferralitis]